MFVPVTYDILWGTLVANNAEIVHLFYIHLRGHNVFWGERHGLYPRDTHSMICFAGRKSKRFSSLCGTAEQTAFKVVYTAAYSPCSFSML